MVVAAVKAGGVLGSSSNDDAAAVERVGIKQLETERSRAVFDSGRFSCLYIAELYEVKSNCGDMGQ
jgi:hypothetical protein